MQKLTWEQAAAWRVRRQHLDRRARAGSMLAVASRLCGLHAQLISSAELTVWARVEGLKRGAVQRALWEERTLVKTWAMRGTLHLLPARELPLWYAGLKTSRRYLRPLLWRKHYGITLEELERLTEMIAAALENRVMTREELVKEVAKRIGSSGVAAKLAYSWGTVLKPAAFTGRLCFGPSVGQRVRFTRPDTWLTLPPARFDGQSATAEIARRFLATYGPATYRDLARWWGDRGGMATARQWISSLGDEVTSVELGGQRAWMLVANLRELRELPASRSVRLLPGFDQYVVAASCHAHQLLPGDLRQQVYRPQGWLSPVLLVNGMMQGTWRHSLKGSRLEVTVEPFVEIPSWARRAAGEEAERLASFLNCHLHVIWKRSRSH